MILKMQGMVIMNIVYLCDIRMLMKKCGVR